MGVVTCWHLGHILNLFFNLHLRTFNLKFQNLDAEVFADIVDCLFRKNRQQNYGTKQPYVLVGCANDDGRPQSLVFDY